MNIENKILDSVIAQLQYNENKNLFCINPAFYYFKISDDTYNFICGNKTELFNYLSFLFNQNAQSKLIDKIAELVLNTFYKSNQFVTFSETDICELKKYYLSFILGIKDILSETAAFTIEELTTNHYNNLRKWILKTNPFVEKINRSDNPYLKEVVCSEYSTEMQLELLDINIRNLNEPVIDIGCGMHANLVNFLRAEGIDAYGLDRMLFANSGYLIKNDWFGFEFNVNSWGTIIANMSFSNHFRHHHYRTDGRFEDFARKYNQILNSLKLNGKFIYSPSLPFIEQHINETKFRLTLNLSKTKFGVTHIIKMT
jgi:hypothetical protein